MSSDSFYHLQPWGKSLFWFIFLNSVLLPLLMLQPALTPALCSIRWHQMSCIEISDFRFRSHLYCFPMIFACLGLPVCPSTPAIQPLLYRVKPKGSHGPVGVTSQISQQPENSPLFYSTWAIACCWDPIPVSIHSPRLSKTSQLLACTFAQMLMALCRQSRCVNWEQLALCTHMRSQKGEGMLTMCKAVPSVKPPQHHLLVTRESFCSKTNKLETKAGTKLSFCLHLL